MEQKENKNKNPKWCIIAFIAIIAFAVIAGSLSGGEKKDYSQKDTITYNDAEYSIKKVEKDDKYINVTIKIKNKGNETLSYSNLHFVMINEKGKEVDYEKFAFDDGTLLTSGELEPNEEIEGIITWLQNKSNKRLRIRYYENVITSQINDYKFQWSLDN